MELLSSKKGTNGNLIITLEITGDESLSFLDQEENLAILLNQAGLLATKSLLSELDSQASSLKVEGKVHYKKSVQKKSTKALTAK